jgi:hypothetical protein
MPEVDFVLGTFDKYTLPELLTEEYVKNEQQGDEEKFISAFSSGDRTRTF